MTEYSAAILQELGLHTDGPEIALNKPTTWPQPQHTTNTDTSRYGTATAASWDRVHPRLTHRGCWIDHPGEITTSRFATTMCRVSSGGPMR